MISISRREVSVEGQYFRVRPLRVLIMMLAMMALYSALQGSESSCSCQHNSAEVCGMSCCGSAETSCGMSDCSTTLERAALKILNAPPQFRVAQPAFAVSPRSDYERTTCSSDEPGLWFSKPPVPPPKLSS